MRFGLTNSYALRWHQQHRRATDAAILFKFEELHRMRTATIRGRRRMRGNISRRMTAVYAATSREVEHA